MSAIPFMSIIATVQQSFRYFLAMPTILQQNDVKQYF